MPIKNINDPVKLISYSRRHCAMFGGYSKTRFLNLGNVSCREMDIGKGLTNEV